MAFHQVFAEWSQWGWRLVANHMWQTTIFVLVAWGTVLLFKNRTARVRYWIWMIALVKLLLPSALLMMVMERAGVNLWKTLPMAAPLIYANADILIVGTQSGPQGYRALYSVLTLIWALGATVFLMRWWMRSRQLRLLLRAGTEVTAARAVEAFHRAKLLLLPNRKISLITAPGLQSLCVVRIWRPVIILPDGLTDHLSDRELEAVMMHELVHVKRYDNLMGTLQMLFCCLFWFHPLVWLIDHRLLSEREIICDEMVIGYSGDARLYAASLWKVAQVGFGWNFAGISRATGSTLLRRIRLMLNTERRTEVSALGRLVASTAICGLVVFALGMAVFTRANVSAAQSADTKATAQEKQSSQDETETAEPMSADLKPTILYKTKAVYTPEARANGVEGLVMLSMVFAKDGTLKNIQVERGLPDGLSEQAIYAAQQLRFEPARKDGERVSVRGRLEFTFKLN